MCPHLKETLLTRYWLQLFKIQRQNVLEINIYIAHLFFAKKCRTLVAFLFQGGDYSSVEHYDIY